jgi:SAM-dependent methyltransferase
LESLALAYRDADFDSSVESKYAATTYAEIVATMGVQKGRALDIGAGDGAFLERLLELGFSEVVGVEPSSAPIAAASNRIRPMLRQELFDPEKFKPSSFDLITCFQTIEHVYDPRELLQGMKSILRPGGMVLFVMHDAASLSARILRSRSPIFDVEHLQLFSERPARWLLNDFGFEGVSVNQVENRYPIRYWCRLFPFPAFIKGRLLTLLSRNKIGDLQLSLRPGNLAVAGRLP